jgi:hypothetical protein
VNKPNFLIIGAPKCGTTSLYEYVDQHPDVFMSTPKETRFFDSWEYEDGLRFYWDTYFEGWAGQIAVGEATPNYLCVPFVALRIRESLPDTKLIAVLRNPVDRSYSGWWMKYSRGREKLPFEDAVYENFKRLQSSDYPKEAQNEYQWYGYRTSRKKGISKYRHYLEHGHYAEHLKRYLSLFPAAQLKTVFFGDLCRNPQAIMQEIWEFIGVDLGGRRIIKKPRNTAFGSRKIKRLVNTITRTYLHKILPKRARIQIREGLSKFGERPNMNKEIRAWLIDYYDKRNRELEELTGRNLAHWGE